MGYFLDTYAMVEIIKGNKNYLKFIHEELFTSIFHLYELYYSLIRDYDEDKAKYYFFRFKKNILKFNDNNLFVAARFKLNHKKNNISYADSLGYVLSNEHNVKFLTGDKEFENLDNVEFVK